MYCDQSLRGMYGPLRSLLMFQLCMEDRIPKLLCYICYSQLQRCCRFINMSQKAGKILAQLVGEGVQVCSYQPLQQAQSTILKKRAGTLQRICLKLSKAECPEALAFWTLPACTLFSLWL